MSFDLTGGQLEVIVGCMYSGKSEELIRRLRRARIAKRNVFVVRPEIDTRSKGVLASHAKSEFPALELKTASEILTSLPVDAEVVGIDEAQFFGSELIDVCYHLLSQNVRVIVAGLELDYKARAFGPMPFLMALSDRVDKLTAICTVCGGTATRSCRLTPSHDLIQIGAQGAYEARCHEHFSIPEEG